MTRKARRNEFLRDGGVCPECAGVIVGYGMGWLCLSCRAHWGIRIHPDADLSKKGFPVAPR